MPSIFSRKVVKNTSQLRKIDVNYKESFEKIKEIQLHQLDLNFFDKLECVLQFSPLEKVEFRKCFPNATDLTKALKALGENSFIEKLDLDLKENPFDVESADEIRNLLSLKIIGSLTLPRQMDEICTAEILQEIHEKEIRLKELNLSGAEINEISKDRLKYILQSTLISHKLVMLGCKDVGGATLTTELKSTLEKANNSSQSWYNRFFTGKLQILWFNHVKHAGPVENDDDYETKELEHLIRPMFGFGKAEKIVRLFIREKGCGDWQFLRRGRKRKSKCHAESNNAKVAKVKEERVHEALDDLGDMFKNLSHTSTPPLTESSIVTTNIERPQSSMEATPSQGELYAMGAATSNPTLPSDPLLTSREYSPGYSPSEPREIQFGETCPHRRALVKTPSCDNFIGSAPVNESCRPENLHCHRGNYYSTQNTPATSPVYDNHTSDFISNIRENDRFSPGTQRIPTPFESTNTWNAVHPTINRQLSYDVDMMQQKLARSSSQVQGGISISPQEDSPASSHRSFSLPSQPSSFGQQPINYTHTSMGRAAGNEDQKGSRDEQRVNASQNTSINIQFTAGPITRSQTQRDQHRSHQSGYSERYSRESESVPPFRTGHNPGRKKSEPKPLYTPPSRGTRTYESKETFFQSPRRHFKGRGNRGGTSQRNTKRNGLTSFSKNY